MALALGLDVKYKMMIPSAKAARSHDQCMLPHLLVIMVLSLFRLTSPLSLSPSSFARTRATRLFSSFTHSSPFSIVFLGTPEVAASTLSSLITAASKSTTTSTPFTVTSVVTQPPRPSGRKRKLTPSPVQTCAMNSPDIHLFTPESAKDTDFLQSLEDLKPNLMVTAAYGCYLPKRFLKIPTHGTVNIHPSLLPLHRGASPVQSSLTAGDSTLGVSLLFTVSSMDAGPIISRVSEPNDGESMAYETLTRLFDKGTTMLVDALPRIIEGKITFEGSETQDEEKATSAGECSRDECERAFNVASRSRNPGVNSALRGPGNGEPREQGGINPMAIRPPTRSS